MEGYCSKGKWNTVTIISGIGRNGININGLYTFIIEINDISIQVTNNVTACVVSIASTSGVSIYGYREIPPANIDYPIFCVFLLEEYFLTSKIDKKMLKNALVRSFRSQMNMMSNSSGIKYSSGIIRVVRDNDKLVLSDSHITNRKLTINFDTDNDDIESVIHYLRLYSEELHKTIAYGINSISSFGIGKLLGAIVYYSSK